MAESVPSESPWIVDVDDADFERVVLDGSAERPVVVDFWAPWCGPCRSLAPILEARARQADGAFTLARVNIDEAGECARAFGISSIPAVKAFRAGAVVDEFLGAQPESVVRAFLEGLAPSEAELATARGDAALAQGEGAAAEAAYGEALALDRRRAAAHLGLARVYADRGQRAEALSHLDEIPSGEAIAADAEALAAKLRLEEAGDSDLDALRARVTSDSSAATQLALGSALAARGETREALVTLLASLEADAHFEDDAARKVMLDIFQTLGGDHPLTQEFRPALARLLYR